MYALSSISKKLQFWQCRRIHCKIALVEYAVHIATELKKRAPLRNFKTCSTKNGLHINNITVKKYLMLQENFQPLTYHLYSVVETQFRIEFWSTIISFEKKKNFKKFLFLHPFLMKAFRKMKFGDKMMLKFPHNYYGAIVLYSCTVQDVAWYVSTLPVFYLSKCIYHHWFAFTKLICFNFQKKINNWKLEPFCGYRSSRRGCSVKNWSCSLFH